MKQPSSVSGENKELRIGALGAWRLALGRRGWLLVALLALAGCKKPVEPQPASLTQPAAATPSGSGAGQPVLPSSGVTNGPVTQGGGDFGDSGGSVGYSLKDKARKMAGSQSGTPPPGNQPGPGTGGTPAATGGDN